MLLEATSKVCMPCRYLLQYPTQFCTFVWNILIFPEMFPALKTQKMPNYTNNWGDKISGNNQHSQKIIYPAFPQM